MSSAPRIVFCAPAAKPEPWLRGLAEWVPDAELWAWNESSADLATRMADYAVVWTPPDAFYPSQPKLRAIFNLGAGVDGLLRSPALPDDIPLVRLEDAGMAPLMAEYVLQAAVRYARELDRMDDDRRAHRWVPHRTSDRADFPVGVMGAGALGQPVARMLAAHGFPVTLWSRHAKAIDGLRCYGGQDELAAFLAATRILVCLLPLTPDTEDIIDHALLDRLMPDAYLINVARGHHVVDADLLAAIADGKIIGATLDVFREEPLPASHPFWQEPRITITPHCSALTQRKETLKQIAAKIRQFERGETVSGIVDRARGY
jgi:glyoxylate/hydroxypyruvate reductase A